MDETDVRPDVLTFVENHTLSLGTVVDDQIRYPLTTIRREIQVLPKHPDAKIAVVDVLMPPIHMEDQLVVEPREVRSGHGGL